MILATVLTADGIALPIVDSARDLGVTISRDLSPSLHVATSLRKLISAQQPFIEHLDLAM